MQRRKFIRQAALGLTGACAGWVTAWAGSKKKPAVKKAATTVPPAAPPGPKTVVAVVTSRRIFKSAETLDQAVVAQMLRQGVGAQITDQRPGPAWNAWFKADDVVGIKVDGSQGAYGGYPQLVFAVAAELVQAGVRENNIIIFDHDDEALTLAGFTINTTATGIRCFSGNYAGYEEFPVELNGLKVRMSKIISQLATALINLPVLGPRPVAGMTGAFMNYVGTVENPAALEPDGYLRAADLYRTAALRQKTRLVLVNGCGVSFPLPPGSAESGRAGGLLCAVDPVACDTVGFLTISGAWPGSAVQRPSPALPAFIRRAAALGLGCDRMDRIDPVCLTIE